jgi:hypothetical protein
MYAVKLNLMSIFCYVIRTASLTVALFCLDLFMILTVALFSFNLHMILLKMLNTRWMTI